MSDNEQLYAEAEKLRDSGDIEGAIAKLNEVLAADENHVLAHLALAVVYIKAAKPEEAVKHGQRACEIEPDDPFNFTALSVTAQRAFEGTQNQGYIQMAEDAMARAHAIQGHQH